MQTQPTVLILGWTFVAQLTRAELLYCPEMSSYKAFLNDSVIIVCFPLETDEHHNFAKSLSANPLLQTVRLVGYVQKRLALASYQEILTDLNIHAVVLEDELPNYLEEETRLPPSSNDEANPDEYSQNPHYHLYRRLEAERRVALLESQNQRLQLDYSTLLETAKSGARAVSEHQRLKSQFNQLQNAYIQLESKSSGEDLAEIEAEHALELMNLTMSFAEERISFEAEIDRLQSLLEGSQASNNDSSTVENGSLGAFESANHVLEMKLVEASQEQVNRIDNIISQSNNESLELINSDFQNIKDELDAELEAFEAELAHLKLTLGA